MPSALRDLDRQIAEKVFGYTVLMDVPAADDPLQKYCRIELGDGDWRALPYYSTHVTPAFGVVQWLTEQGYLVILKAIPDGFPFLGPEDMGFPKMWRRAVCELQFMKWRTHPGRDTWSSADTIPAAICKAALMVLEAQP